MHRMYISCTRYVYDYKELVPTIDDICSFIVLYRTWCDCNQVINDPKSFLFCRIERKQYFHNRNGFNHSIEHHQNCGVFFLISCSKSLFGAIIQVSVVPKAATGRLKKFWNNDYYTRGWWCLIRRQVVSSHRRLEAQRDSCRARYCWSCPKV